MKSYIIRLKNNDFSCKIAEECIQAALRFNLNIDFFDAVNGEEASIIFENDKIFKYPKSLKKETLGVKGCAASHYLLWKQCAKDNVPYLILEHDAYMIRPLPENIEEKIIDVCKLDSNSPYDESYDDEVSENRGDQIVDYDLSWGYKKKSAPYGGYFKGAWSYIIQPHAAKKILEQIKLNGWVPADKQFGKNILHLQATQSTIFRIHKIYNHSNIYDLSLTRN